MMVQEQARKAYRPEFKTDRRRRRSGHAFAWELRQAVTWTWILPLLVVVGIFLFTWWAYQTDLHALAPTINAAHRRIKVVLDYIDPLRNTLELLLPILSVFLATDLLIKEWRRGTLAFLATRKPLPWFLAIRFVYLLGYLLLLNVAAILLSWWMTPQPLTDLSMDEWLWQTLLTIMASTLLLMTLALLTAHLSVSSVAGYVLPACCWLANWLYALQVEQSHTTSAALSYLLFGWSDQNLTPHPEAWLAGKIILCIVAVPLLAIQPWLLRRVALRHRDAE